MPQKPLCQKLFLFFLVLSFSRGGILVTVTLPVPINSYIVQHKHSNRKRKQVLNFPHYLVASECSLFVSFKVGKIGLVLGDFFIQTFHRTL